MLFSWLGITVCNNWLRGTMLLLIHTATEEQQNNKRWNLNLSTHSGLFLQWAWSGHKYRQYCSTAHHPWPLLFINTLTGIWDLKPWCCSKDSLACICAGIEAVFVYLRWENVSHGENETQQPWHQDGHDDLRGGEKKILFRNLHSSKNGKKNKKTLIMQLSVKNQI